MAIEQNETTLLIGAMSGVRQYPLRYSQIPVSLHK